MPQSNNALIAIPSVDHNLPHLSPIERSAEVLRYSFRSFEYSVSPNGVLRKVLKIIGLVAVIAVAAFPVVCIAAQIAAMLAAIISNLLVVVFGLLILCFIGKAVVHRR